MKKVKLLVVICLILATILMCCACSATDNSITSEDGKWNYIENDDGTIQLTKVVEMTSELVIPKQVDGKIVSSIAEKFFVKINDGSSKKKFKDTYADNDVLESVIIEAEIKEIPNMAFYLCRKLSHVELPNSLEKINDFAFYGCIALEDIIIPENCKHLGAYSFRECSNLKNVTLNSSEIVNIGDKCFYMINNKASGDDQYYIIDGLKINVGDVDYSIETLEALRKKTRNNTYKYWQEYVKGGAVVSSFAVSE